MEIVRPEDVGLSSERLARIDRHFERQYLGPRKIAGALTLVARRGQVAHFSPLGMMDLARGEQMRTDTIFRIYSMTKPITSVALMTLYEHGHFQLDDAVHRYIPAFRDLRVVFLSSLLRRQLLRHLPVFCFDHCQSSGAQIACEGMRWARRVHE